MMMMMMIFINVVVVAVVNKFGTITDMERCMFIVGRGKAESKIGRKSPIASRIQEKFGRGSVAIM